MTDTTRQQSMWQAYVDREMSLLVPTLASQGYILNEDQPHIGGERFLMQAITTVSGRKLILLGADAHGTRVVIKATSDPAGIRELKHEEKCRDMLARINFAYGTFYSPLIRAAFQKNSQYVTIQEYIEQECPFLERPIETQFDLALRAFKAQESAHATTSRHLKLIRRVFEAYDARKYLQSYTTFKSYAAEHTKDAALQKLLAEAEPCLLEGAATIDQYGGFLTHTDFVPHNIRVQNNTIYLLDHSSLRFGNKHEGWARFLNFMTLYNPALEDALATYIQMNRAPEEVTSLWLMRVYRLGEILRYYAQAVDVSEGDLKTLNQARIVFWSAVLRALLDKKAVSDMVRTTYMQTRDRLRSEDEKKRQKGLH